MMETQFFELLASMGDMALVVIAAFLAWGTPKIVKCFIDIKERVVKLETAFEIHMKGYENGLLA